MPLAVLSTPRQAPQRRRGAAFGGCPVRMVWQTSVQVAAEVWQDGCRGGRFFRRCATPRGRPRQVRCGSEKQPSSTSIEPLPYLFSVKVEKSLWEECIVGAYGAHRSLEFCRKGVAGVAAGLKTGLILRLRCHTSPDEVWHRVARCGTDNDVNTLAAPHWATVGLQRRPPLSGIA